MKRTREYSEIIESLKNEVEEHYKRDIESAENRKRKKLNDIENMKSSTSILFDNIIENENLKSFSFLQTESIEKNHKNNDILFDNKLKQIEKDLPQNRIVLCQDSWIEKFDLPEELKLSDKEFEELWNIHPEEQGEIMLFGKKIPIPRYQQVYGKSYTFSGIKHKAIAYHHLIERYLNYANTHKDYFKSFNDKYINVKFNMCLTNWYQDGSHYINYHSDDEKQILTDDKGGTVILSISFGEERKFYLKSKKDIKDDNRTEFKLNSNSVIVMGGLTQTTHQHSIPKVSGIKGQNIGRRINLTFRIFK